MELPDITTALVEMANEAIEQYGYTFPFVVLVVSADGSVFAAQYLKAGQAAEMLCEHLASKNVNLSFPLDFFFSCPEGRPLTARMLPGHTHPQWVN